MASYGSCKRVLMLSRTVTKLTQANPPDEGYDSLLRARSSVSGGLATDIVHRRSPTVKNKMMSLFSTLSPFSAHSTTESLGCVRLQFHP